MGFTAKNGMIWESIRRQVEREGLFRVVKLNKDILVSKRFMHITFCFYKEQYGKGENILPS